MSISLNIDCWMARHDLAELDGDLLERNLHPALEPDLVLVDQPPGEKVRTNQEGRGALDRLGDVGVGLHRQPPTPWYCQAPILPTWFEMSDIGIV